MKFHELSEDAKIKAMEKFRSTNYFQPDFSLYKEELEEQGFEDPEIFYSGFYAQGDGASFIADVNIEKYLQKNNIIATANNKKMFAAACKLGWVANIKIYRMSSRNCHEQTMMISWNCYFEKTNALWIEDIFQKIIDTILETAKALAKKIYKDLETDYDFSQSEEYIVSVLESPEYSFNFSGDLI